MFNFSKIKKTVMMLAVSAFFATAAFAQSSSAVSAPTVPYSDVLRPSENYSVVVPFGDTYEDSLDVNRMKNLGVAERDALISFLQFDVSSLKNVTVENAYLSLVGSGTGTVRLYQVANDWIDSVSQDAVTELRNTTKPLISEVMNPSADSVYFNGVDLASYGVSSSDGLLSFVLLGDTYTNASFYPYNPSTSLMPVADNGPALSISGYTPVPEPSSMIMGLMGLGSLLGIRRRKA